MAKDLDKTIRRNAKGPARVRGDSSEMQQHRLKDQIEAVIESELVRSRRTVKDAYFNNGAIGFAIMDGDIAVAGSQGLHADFSITNFSRNEPLEEAVTVSITAKPTYSTTAPAWVTTT